MHEQPADLCVSKIQPVLPDVSIFNVPVFLNLEVVGNGGEIAPVSTENASDRILHPHVGRNVRRIIDGVGQDTRLFGLALLVNA